MFFVRYRLQYVSKIFKELVFSRPLVLCYISVTEMMETFCRSKIFGRKLCCFKPSTCRWWKLRKIYTSIIQGLYGILVFSIEKHVLQIIKKSIIWCLHFNLTDVFMLNKIWHKPLSAKYFMFLMCQISRKKMWKDITIRAIDFFNFWVIAKNFYETSKFWLKLHHFVDFQFIRFIILLDYSLWYRMKCRLIFLFG